MNNSTGKIITPRPKGMSTSEAIETLTLMGTPDFTGHTEDILAARKLGIEALKIIDLIRQFPLSNLILQLPGETKD